MPKETSRHALTKGKRPATCFPSLYAPAEQALRLPRPPHSPQKAETSATLVATLVVGVLLVAALNSTLQAQSLNLLTNENFDIDTTGWTVQGGAWNTDSADGSPFSGSVYYNQPGASGGGLFQCVQIHEPGDYEAYVRFRARAGGTTTANQPSRLLVFRFGGTDCATDQLDTESFHLGDSAFPGVFDTSDQWVPTGGAFDLTAEVQSALIYAVAAGGCNGLCETWIDQAVLRLYEPIFLDGFESANVQAWSSIAP